MKKLLCLYCHARVPERAYDAHRSTCIDRWLEVISASALVDDIAAATLHKRIKP